jgi:hypothetical protein
MSTIVPNAVCEEEKDAHLNDEERRKKDREQK